MIDAQDLLQTTFDIKVFAETLDDSTVDQLVHLIRDDSLQHCKVRIMPDTHAGVSCCVGFTSTYEGRINPSFVGCDIACGVYAYKIDKAQQLTIQQLDHNVKNIATGFHNIYREVVDHLDDKIKYSCDLYHYDNDLLQQMTELCKQGSSPLDYQLRSLGTLGSGNHFLEADIDENGDQWIVVHSGSRNFGAMIYNMFEKKLSNKEQLVELLKDFKTQMLRSCRTYLTGGGMATLADNLDTFNEQVKDLPNKSYLSIDSARQYLDACRTAFIYADINRRIMLQKLIGTDTLDEDRLICSLHNYVSYGVDNPTGEVFIRKGAIDASKGKQMIIPLNMRDGSLIAIGKGNEDWNYSAPHGAGRVMSRNAARSNISLQQFEQSMKGIAGGCVCEDTIDEAPMVYKNAEMIERLIEPTAQVIHHLKPIWNYKGV